MRLLNKAFLILLFIPTFLFTEHDVFGQALTNEYILESNSIESLASEYSLTIEDEITGSNIYKVLVQDSLTVITDLETDSRVISISPNHSLAVAPIIELPSALFNASSLDEHWGFQSMNFPADIPWVSEIDIALIDSGVDAGHPFLRDSIKNGYDALLGINFEDDHGHGTQVAGILTKDTPQIKIIPIKTIDSSGTGDLFAFLRGIYYAIEQKVDIINMSFGMRNDHPMVERAIHEAISNRIIVVAASGNSGSSYLLYPARYEEVISVGAYNQNEAKADFSQYGDHLDFMAPGVDIFSTWLEGGYKKGSGTSMAAPFITKTIALIKSTSPHLNQGEIEEIMIAASSPLQGETQLTSGNGKVNVEAALKLANLKNKNQKNLPTKYNVPPYKTWKMKMSLPVDDITLDSDYIHVVSLEGKEAAITVRVDKTDPTIIHILPPLEGYESSGIYELIVEDSLKSASGKQLIQGATMTFTVNGELSN